MLAVIGATVLAPAILQTAIFSGYPFYPFTRPDLLAVDWKVPAEWAGNDLLWIQSWARWPRRPPHEVMALPLAEWVPVWYARVPALEKLAIQAILALAPVYLGCLGFRLWRRSPFGDAGERSALFGVALLGVLAWFRAAPDVRFGWGFLILLALLLAAWALRPALARLPPSLAAVLFAIFLAWQAAPLAESPGRLAVYTLLPADYPIPETTTRQVRTFALLARPAAISAGTSRSRARPVRSGPTCAGRALRMDFARTGESSRYSHLLRAALRRSFPLWERLGVHVTPNHYHSRSRTRAALGTGPG